MLKHLIIKNYALIRHLELHPSASLNVVTGETGAGKSIILGAIGLLTGNRADSKALWDENEKCIIEGVFDLSSYELQTVFENENLDFDNTTVVRREITPAGKSRAFINDTPVTLEIMRAISNRLIDVHSQHETLLLGQHSFQLKLVDSFARNHTLRTAYTAAWQHYQTSKKEYEHLLAQADKLKAEADHIQFQLDELLKANLPEIERNNVEVEIKILEHAEEIKQKLALVLNILNGEHEHTLRHILSEARTTVQPLSAYSKNYEALFGRLNSLLIELDDIIHETEKEETAVEFDTQRAEHIKEQFDTLHRLLRKHQAASVHELLHIQEALQQKAALTSNIEGALQDRKKTLEQAETNLQSAADALSKSRTKVFDTLASSVMALLKELGIATGIFRFDHTNTTPTADGTDKIEILFSANKGIAPKPLTQVASGGEFARLMFCIKYIMADHSSMPTLVLDEIDTGVSGEIALKLGKLMSKMAKQHQLIAISHLPQIAAKGDTHFFVYKDHSTAKTVSVIKRLTPSERIEKIAEMIGGSKPSKAAIDNAKELLKIN